MGKTVRTIKGDIDKNRLGKTMVHEHLFWDGRCWYQGDPEELTLRDLYYQKVRLDNRGLIYHHCHQVLDNNINTDLDLAIKEAKHFKMAGGGTIVDVTSIGIGRDPQALLAVSEMTGLNIIMGSGFYTANSHPSYVKEMSENDLADMIINDLTKGVKNTGLKAGIIGEIGFSSSEFNPEEIKVLKAAVIAQKEVGVAITLHPPEKKLDLLDIMEKSGADMERIIVGHIDPTVDSPEYLDALAKRGVYIAYDQFGIELPMLNGYFKNYYVARDKDRIESIKQQIDFGNLSKILVSQDVSFKINLINFGGFGYAHILRDMIPYFKVIGISDDEIDTILIKNPAKVLSF